MMINILKRTILIIMILFISAWSVSYASMVEFTDEEADAQAKQDLIKQQEDDEKNAGKSSNNYLAELSVKGYTLSPEFDKQTINYSIEQPIDVNAIEIEAVADDTRATVSGTGVVELVHGENNLRIDVIAENETTRTYFIKVNTTAKSEVKNEEEPVVTENAYNTELVAKTENKQEGEKTSGLSGKMGLYIILAVVILAIIVLSMGKGNKNKKHRNKH